MVKALLHRPYNTTVLNDVTRAVLFSMPHLLTLSRVHAEPSAAPAPSATAGSLLPFSSAHPEPHQHAAQSSADSLHQNLVIDGLVAGDSSGNVYIYDSTGSKKRTLTWGGRRPHHAAKTHRAPLATHHVPAAGAVVNSSGKSCR